jgi:AmmeMemoRadiSam system protein A
LPGTDALGAALTSRARNAVARALGQAPVDEPAHPTLRGPGATFVTLHTAGALRGCVGSLAATRLLEDDVRANASAAAFRDPRFAPLAAVEFAATRFEVSLLEPSVPLAVASEAEALRVLVPHRDGVTLFWRDRRATLLPQVWQSLPRAADFLAALKQKAGLGAGFWADDVRISRYAVDKFKETETHRLTVPTS